MLLLTLHHIVFDGWSFEVFWRELMRSLYRLLYSASHHHCSALPLQYPDFALWQRQWLQGDMSGGTAYILEDSNWAISPPMLETTYRQATPARPELSGDAGNR